MKIEIKLPMIYHKWTTEEIVSECAAACEEVAKYWEALDIKEADKCVN